MVNTPSPPKNLVLIIEDDRMTRIQLRSLLQAEGYDVTEAENGEQGVVAFKQLRPDLVLLDALMPTMDGFTCCEQLHLIANGNAPPILMITGLEDQTSVDRAFEVGTTDFITKPIHWAVLRQRVRRLLEASQSAAALQQLNANLEQQVLARTIQLQQALDFEATLKRITDKVRDGLDESSILQTAVQELAAALRVDYCATAVFSQTKTPFNIRYEYPSSLTSDHNWGVHLANSAEIRAQFNQNRCLQFCNLPDNKAFPLLAHQATTLVCPIFDDQDCLGELWLLNPPQHTFSELETRLVQQVANQCAIAIRQARLFQAAQAQVAELEQLNSVKDDFLNTVSHELRTPVANMKMAIQMLELSIKRVDSALDTSLETQPLLSRIDRYFQILNEECNREMHLINDLLDLQRLDAGAQLLLPTPIHLQTWLPYITEPFEHRFEQHQHQLIITIAEEIPNIVTDSSSLERILAELLNNACKYTPPGGTIKIVAGLGMNTVQLKVINTGAKISADDLPRIFDRFYQIPNSNPGKYHSTGLGLALVRKLVTYLGGTIQVTSNSQETCFTIELPLAI
jgi:signal transduction histidine kinase/CheY-like chemotaxis protein